MIAKLLILLGYLNVAGILNANIEEQAYIRNYSTLAIEEMQTYGIPASIKLAQALVESNAGRSVLAQRANNHFGIKCKSYWTGGEYYYVDDDRDKAGRLIPSCFRVYASAGLSYTDHSTFLRGSERYSRLFTYEITDYKRWATGLQACGYATDPGYSRKLITTIEQFRLYEYDLAGLKTD